MSKTRCCKDLDTPVRKKLTIHKGIRGVVRLEFVQFNFENYDLIDSKLQKVFENFDEN